LHTFSAVLLFFIGKHQKGDLAVWDGKVATCSFFALLLLVDLSSLSKQKMFGNIDD
jgi:hypothetical protein